MKKIMIVALLSAFAAPAFAEDRNAADMHMYAGLRAGQAKTNIEDNSFNTGADSKNPSGWGVFIGHMFNPAFALELEYLNLGEIKSGTNSAKSTGLSLSGLGSFPVNDQFSLFGKLGYALITGKPGGTFTGSDRKSRAVTYGFGAQFNVTPTVGVRLGWDKYKFRDSGFNGNANLVSLAGVFMF